MSGRELAEWEAFLSLEGRVQEHIGKGVDPALAERMVWSPASGNGVPKRKKRKVKGKG